MIPVQKEGLKLAEPEELPHWLLLKWQLLLAGMANLR